MIKASFTSYPLKFIRPAGTSRGTLKTKPCWFIRLEDEEGRVGLGEVSFIPGICPDPEDMDIRLDHICKLISRGEMEPRTSLPGKPGIQFALETALLDLRGGGRRELFRTAFSRGEKGIRTNGLIWMGNREFMMSQIHEKMLLGFRVLKLKVGSLDPIDELQIVKWIRSEYGGGDLEIRLDANGAWSPEVAPERMDAFAKYGIHSIEQPIAARQIEAMAELCKDPAIPVALDEELIGVCKKDERRRIVETIRPAYLILKPGLLGGLATTREWIRLADEFDSGWWVTSALESSIGLNAIAQWTSSLDVTMPQGLGTGAIYTNNILSPLKMSGEELWYREGKWFLDPLKF